MASAPFATPVTKTAQTAPWWQGAVIYQVYPRSFCDSHGSGVGDLAGITARLDHVAGLGVDAIWVSPFVASPQKDYGYDVSDYCAVDPLFGHLDDAKALIARAHDLGLRVLMDQVWSHTSDQHPWFQASRQDRQNPQSDWYIWCDPRPDGTPPNNWLSVFGGAGWTWDARRGQYYLHHFLPEQPALNLRHPAVRQAITEVGRFWLTMGVDGFRLDAVDFMLHDPALTDNPPRPQPHSAIKPYSFQRHLYDLAHAETAGLLRQIRAALPLTTWAAEPPLLVVEVGSEVCALPPLARAGTYTRPDPAAAEDGPPAHLAYSLAMMKTTGDAPNLARLITQARDEAQGGALMWAFSNHDVARVATRWGGDNPVAARAYMALLASMPGALCLYQGEELGLPEAEIPREALRDPVGIALWPQNPGRDGCRTPMPWTAEGGFSLAAQAAEPWLPVPESHRSLAVDQQTGRPDSLLTLTQNLLAWRKGWSALRWGEVETVEAKGSVLHLLRRYGAQTVALLVNLGDQPQALAADWAGRSWQPVLTLPAWQAGATGQQIAPWGVLACEGLKS
jgi:alpha-glucosidase